jgi:hypothetical protein
MRNLPILVFIYNIDASIRIIKEDDVTHMEDEGDDDDEEENKMNFLDVSDNQQFLQRSMDKTHLVSKYIRSLILILGKI